MAGDTDTVCFGWQLTSFQFTSSGSWQRLAKGSTQSKAPGCDPLRRGKLVLLWLSLIWPIVVHPTTCCWLYPDLAQSIKKRREGVAMWSQLPVKNPQLPLCHISIKTGWQGSNEIQYPAASWYRNSNIFAVTKTRWFTDFIFGWGAERLWAGDTCSY